MKQQFKVFAPRTSTSIIFLIMLLFCRNSVNGQEYNPCPPNDGNPQFLECYSYPDGLCILNSGFMASENYTFGTGPSSVTTNGGIPSGGGTVQGQNIIINGLYQISVDVEFIDCVFKMGPGAEIRLIDNAGGSLKVSFSSCDFFSCTQLWKGIWTQFSNTLNPTALEFDFQSNRVENAYIALNLDEGSDRSFLIALNIFENNYIGIANRRKLFMDFNAVIHSNTFQGTSTLLPSSLTSSSFAHTGVKLEKVVAVVGVPEGGPLDPYYNNTFRCLLQGVHSIIAFTTCINNHFQNMERFGTGGYGINAEDGTIAVYNNVFDACKENGIFAFGASLYAQRNRFFGKCEIGILSTNNFDSENIRIDDHNDFTLDNTFIHGISVQRSEYNGMHDPGLFPMHVINDNDFNINFTDQSKSDAYGIKLIGANTTSAIFEMARNDMNIICAGGMNAIEIIIAQSRDLWVHNNDIEFTYPTTAGASSKDRYGIKLSSGGTSADLINTRVHKNIITCIPPPFNPDNSTITCAIHFDGIVGVEFCGNEMDRSARGIHAQSGTTAVILKENEFMRHDECLLLNTNIGPQPCRGNRWSTSVSDCKNFAAQNTAVFQLASLIEACESNLLPFLPPATKVSPMNGWVTYNDTIPQETCNYEFLPAAALGSQLTWFEEAEINGQGNYASFLEQWEVRQKLYTKLHEHSNLRPTGSAADVFYNFHSGSLLAGFAQVELLINNAMTISVTDQANFDMALTGMETAAQALLALDALQNFNNPSSLTGSYFGTRETHLQAIATDHVLEQNTQIVRKANMLSGLQAALNANNALNTSIPYESARKYILGYRINRLLGTPLTQSEYQYLKSIADGDPGLLGHDAINDAILLLKPCDQITYITQERHNEGEHAEHAMDRTKKQDSEVIDLHIAPNPTNSSAIISFDRAIVARIDLMDLMGRLVLRQVVSENQPNVTLELAKISQGIFKVRCFDNNGRFLAEKNLSITH